MADFLAARVTEGGPPMTDLDRAVARLRRALAARERIVVYGDYDVDGIAGSAILVRAFRQLGVAVGAYIPNRYEEGYGLNSAALRQLAQDGATVIVSVDCGVTAVKEAALARELGVDLIVTDHHHPPAELPDAYALVNPRRPGDPSRLIASSKKIKKDLGWRPQFESLDAIIGSAWKWHQKFPRGYGD